MSGSFFNLLRFPEPEADPLTGQPRELALRDYAHASKIFRSNSYQLAPKLKFLFHVYFEINNGNYAIPFPPDASFGLIVKTVKLPSYQAQISELNQYNRKRIVQTKIKYENVDITWHDDHSNLMNKLWFNYYTYYYGDSLNRAENVPNGASAGVSNPMTVDFTNRSQYQAIENWGDQNWGYQGEFLPGTFPTLEAQLPPGIKPPFFKNIHIYGFSQHKFTRYTLINPIITSFTHDTYAYAEGNGVMENRMTLNYEFVKYYEGEMDGRDPEKFTGDFGDPATYDRKLSPYVPTGANKYVPTSEGLKDANGGSIQDLATSSRRAAVSTTVSNNTYANPNLNPSNQTNIVDDRSSIALATQAVTNQTRNVAFAFPAYGESGTTSGTAGAPTIGLSQPPTVTV